MRKCKNFLVTGGLGFMGSAFIRYLFSLKDVEKSVCNLDLVTYAANVDNLQSVIENQNYFFYKGNIQDQNLVSKIIQEHAIDTIVHFAAETHVDRSITGPLQFVETNVFGTLNLLEVIRNFPHIHFHHVSTDEVYGSLGEGGFFTEHSPYLPNSPYSASKAASDHFVRAYHKTYGLSVTISHASNNFGPGQHFEKLLPLCISKALEKEPIPIYGRGQNIRDWLFVEDHAEGVFKILQKGKSGEVYNLGGQSEKNNLDMVKLLLKLLSDKTTTSYEDYLSLLCFVKDRPGHDYRYGIDGDKSLKELGFFPKHTLEEGLIKTIDWYLLQRELVQAKR